jgi:hypothetical protein
MLHINPWIIYPFFLHISGKAVPVEPEICASSFWPKDPVLGKFQKAEIYGNSKFGCPEKRGLEFMAMTTGFSPP